ncbi:uncharacterized protein [Diadema antillarum]|uniref:uncharacterized protein n=1 Tax=Diadema antillarum TaxID=105358 RepID=UPI003A876EE1
MSTQRGNVKKSRTQKHKNTVVFKNSMHDTSKRTKQLNDMCISDTCARCKDILEWKIKYKKYKPLTQPKRCTKCQEKTIKNAYRIICENCAEADGICTKCGKPVGDGSRQPLGAVEQGAAGEEEEEEELEKEFATPSEKEKKIDLREREKGVSLGDKFSLLHIQDKEIGEGDRDECSEKSDDGCHGKANTAHGLGGHSSASSSLSLPVEEIS